jgi:hypothetical protein
MLKAATSSVGIAFLMDKKLILKLKTGFLEKNLCIATGIRHIHTKNM